MAQQQQLGVDTCPICLTAMAKGAALFTTACGHQFHFNCIKDAVAHGNFVCPMCRGPMAQLAPAAAQPHPPPPSIMAMQQQQMPPFGLPMFSAPPGAPMRGPMPSRAPAAAFSTFPTQQTVSMYVPNVDIPLDDPLPHDDVEMTDQEKLAAATASQQQQHEGAGLRLETSTEAKEVLFSQAEDSFFGMVSVVASAAPVTAEQKSRSGIDIVAVIDKSGSMSGEKINLLKLSLKYMLTQLGSHDRFSIVSFNSGAQCVCGLRTINQTGAREVEALIERLSADGGTSIWAGLSVGLNVLQKRRERNPVCTVLLLTDGQDGGALAPAREALRDGSSRHIDGLTLHTFGFGRDHDAGVCSQLAELGHGGFNYIENVDQLGPAFATAIGGLLTVAAQEITLIVQAAPSVLGGAVTLTRVHTQFRTTRDDATGAISVKIPDIYQGERRDILVELKVAAVDAAMGEPQSLATAALSFASAPAFDRANMAHASATLAVLRPPKIIDASRNPEIEVQRLRIAAADCMTQAIALAQANKNTEAKALLTAQIARIQESASARHPMCVGIMSDLRQCIVRVEPQEFRSGGWAAMQSMQVQQAQQRVSLASPSAQMYVTPAQCQQQAQWSSYASAQPKRR